MFFIVGRGRSGTTLLRSMLDAHPAVTVAPEALFILTLYRSYRSGRWSERRIRRFCRHLFLEERMRRWAVSREDLESRWIARLDDASFARLCADVYEAQADAMGKAPGRLLGDKNPLCALFVHQLAEVFPRAKFVHLVRDYRDNVRSYQQVPFDLNSSAALAYRWKRFNASILEVAERRPARFHRVRFEDLVASPVPVLEAVYRFLGAPADHVMPASLHDPGDGLGLPWHRHMNRPIDTQLAGQWQQDLSAEHVSLIDRICQPFGRRFGYAPVTAGMERAGVSGGIALGWAMTWLERLVVRLPVRVAALIIRSYRRLTGNVIR